MVFLESNEANKLYNMCSQYIVINQDLSVQCREDAPPDAKAAFSKYLEVSSKERDDAQKWFNNLQVHLTD